VSGAQFIYLSSLQHALTQTWRQKSEQLASTGKCKKLAITAIMRKLIVMANALLRDQRKWTYNLA
jgi:hypothetical protein